jgi:NhaP-type Na+/H+ or K+/H+ antiporter
MVRFHIFSLPLHSSQSFLSILLTRHHLKGGFPQGLLLAGPGVVLGAFLMGFFVYYCIPSLGWSWNFSMVFGAVSSATDTVAVVSVLKSARASPKLTMAIISESLLNDGVAMVIFTLFFNMVKGKIYSADEIILYFIKMAFGSPLFGCGVGLIFVAIIRKINNPLEHRDITMQIAFSICCAYLTFYVAEHELHLSGLLACYGAGAMFSCYSHPLILEPETMHHVWEMIEWIGNTLIFLLAGVIIGFKILDHITAIDIGYLLLLYVMLLLFRYIIVFLLYPILSRVGLKCSFHDAIFISWAGLRGALAMALALIVQSEAEEEDHIHESQTKKFFFFIGGLAALTLIINATTAQHLLEFLGLLKLESPDKVLVMEQIKKRLKNYLLKQSKVISKNLKIGDTDRILEYNTLLSNADLFHRLSVAGGRLSGAPLTGSPFRQSIGPGGSGDYGRSFSRRTSRSPLLADLLCYVRTIYLDIIRVEYWRMIHEGKLPRKSYAIQTLLYSIDYGLDNVDLKNLQDWIWISSELNESYLIKLLTSVTSTCCPSSNSSSSSSSSLHYLLDVLESRNQEFQIYVLMSVIEGHEIAQKKIFRFMGEEDTEEDEDLRIPELTIVLLESKEVVRRAKKLLSRIDEHVISNIVCRQAGRTLLTYQVEYVMNLVEEGLLSHNDSEQFLELARDDLAHLEARARREFRSFILYSFDVLPDLFQFFSNFFFLGIMCFSINPNVLLV